MKQFTLIRSFDCSGSNHEPNRVVQTGIRAAAPRVNREGYLYPAIGSVIARYHGANHPTMPAYAGFIKSRSHIAQAGYLGRQYDSFDLNSACALPVYDLVGHDTGTISRGGLLAPSAQAPSQECLRERCALLHALDRTPRERDPHGAMMDLDRYQSQALDIIAGQRLRTVLNLDREPDKIRAQYGTHLWCRQALLARRLVEAGCPFISIDLSYHTASGTWDTHGDNIPPYGGIAKGLKPLLPIFDHLITTLVNDLEAHGLLQQTLVLAMGEFGRTPLMGTQGSSDGRNHWPVIMSLVAAGGGFSHGQVIGASEKDGGRIKERPVSPADLAATIYRFFDIPLDTSYLDHSGRPRAIIEENGQPLREWF